MSLPAVAASQSIVQSIFGPAGFFAQHFSSYEPREGQMAAAELCEKVMREGGTALIEAPCGTGKSFAYGSMAAWFAAQGKKVCIVTANIALQEQLIKKDLPTLRRVLPWEFHFAMLKGRSNYACLLKRGDGRLESVRREFSLKDQDQLDDVIDWIDSTSEGDVSELPFIPLPRIWSNASMSSDKCRKTECKHFAGCFAERARREAFDAGVVVTNYHLFFAHVSVMSKYGRCLVLPKFDIVIFDEGHDAADVARDFFGFKFSHYSVRSVADHIFDPELISELLECSQKFFSAVEAYGRSSEYVKFLRDKEFVDPKPLFEVFGKTIRHCMSEAATADGERRQDLNNAEKLLRTLWGNMVVAIYEQPEDHVFWIDLPREDSRESVKIVAQLIVPGPAIAQCLYPGFKDPPQPEDDDGRAPIDFPALRPSAVIITSATLMTGGSFAFVRKELGVPAQSNVHELEVDSPFDFQKQALLVIPRLGATPKDDGYSAKLADAVETVIAQCSGRTLGLFTSYKNLNAVYDRLKATCPYRLLKQGDAPRLDLVAEFQRDVNSVLLGTSSFWTGVDVPGEALTGLIVDKLPFPRPDEPLTAAIDERDPNAFANYMIPKAIMQLRQGVGRLVRSRKDVGVIVLCDDRVLTKRYGSTFMRSLPKMRQTREIEEIGRFLARTPE